MKMAHPNPSGNSAVYRGSYYRALPNAKHVRPRGTARVERSSDLLFVAAALRTMEIAGGRLLLFAHPTDREDWYYRVHAADGRYLHPVTGIELPPDGTHTVKMELKVQTLRAHLRKSGYAFRQFIKSGVGGMNIQCEGDALARHMSPAGAPPALDPILDHFHLLKLLDFPRPARLKPGQLICPLDGPVTPCSATMRSPRATWRALCGREWHTTFCPCCLFQFEERPGKMS
jgi:hypothetical protein